jgi:hypothetical protein
VSVPYGRTKKRFRILKRCSLVGGILVIRDKYPKRVSEMLWGVRLLVGGGM